MLSENLKFLRKAKGLSQEELAIKLNVVRQTVSKWEKGLSVPDSQMLIRIAEELDTTVSVLLGETLPDSAAAGNDTGTVSSAASPDLQTLAAKLEVLNQQFARQAENRRKIGRALATVSCIGCSIALLLFLLITISMLGLSSTNPSMGIIGGADGPTAIFITTSAAPGPGALFLLLAGLVFSIIGLYKTRRK
ncbi:MAG: helix-turn-helix domain-containing protein [Clostridiales bacterium]|nr:helix-turn-helix domain-containing protein [Clostridiales bacterium]